MQKLFILSGFLLFLCLVKSSAQEKVIFYNADSSIRFGGTLDLPAGKKAFPVIILLSGTGKQDRSGTMARVPVFEQIASFLVARGIGVLRTDDRGTGETTGLYDTCTTADFASDALSALHYLKSRKDITGKIGLAGHSEGGAAACMAAAVSDKVDFVISLAGLTAPGLEALIAQNKAIVESTPGVSAVKAKRLNELNEIMFSTVYRNINQPDSILGPLVRDTYTQWRLADDSMMKGKPNQFTDRIMFPQEGYVKQACSKWYRFHIQYNPAQYLPKIKVPVLAVNGDMDIMVPAQVNLPYFKQLITYKKGKLVETLVLPHTNHLLEYCETCTASAFAKPGWKVSDTLLNQLATWISKQ